MRLSWTILLIVAACNQPRAGTPDADDGRVDAPNVSIDASADAMPDAAADAQPDSSPACTTAPDILLDVTPRQIGNIALSGDVLYVSAYELANTGEVSNGAILTVDLTTNEEAYPPESTGDDAAVLYAAGSVVYAALPATGSILRLHPGTTTQPVVTGRSMPWSVTADATHVYWSEASSNTRQIKRIPIGGGAIGDVVDCTDARRLMVIGDEVYCMPFLQGSLLHAPKDGSGSTTYIPNASSYPTWSMILDGANLYLVDFYNNPRILSAPLPDGPATVWHQLTTLGRYSGIASTSTVFYTVDINWGIRRIRRSDKDVQLIFQEPSVSGDPVIWHNRLYFAAANPQLSGQRYVRYCID